MDVNYRETLIAVADDCPVTTGVVPAPRGGKKTLSQIQYELLKDQPYKYTSADVLFESNMLHKGVSPSEVKSRRAELWKAFFSKPQACLRASGLSKKYGWGIHCNHDGRVALCPMESKEYQRMAHAKAGGPKVVKALRSRRHQ